MAGPFNIAIKAVLKQLGKGSARAVPEDIMSGTIRRIKQEASLPETPSRVLGKELDEYTGPHSDFKRKEGLESVDTAKYTEVDETRDTLSALGKDKTDIDLYRKPIKEGGQKLPQKQSALTKSEELEEAARTLQERGSTYQENFKEIRDRVKPKEPYGKVPAVKTEFDIAASLPGKSYERGIIGVNRNLKQGEEVGARFDINAYDWFNTYVATITKKVKGIDKVFGYGPTAVLRDVKFDMVGPEAFKVAQGAGKKPFARFYGKWQDMNPKAAQQKAIDNIKSKEWVEVGFDPSGRGGFYRRDTGDVVGAAEEVIQVGPMLLAKGLKVPTKEQLKKLVVKTNVDSIVFDNKQGGQVSEGLSSIVSRAKGGKTKRKKKDKDFYADFDRKGKPTPELSNRIAISRLMEDLEWERINKEVKRKRREEAEQWEDMKFIQEAMKEDKKGTQMFMPNQDLYKNPIFKDVVTKRKDGGGLSNIKKSININGQPHSLAWINPGEASALRAMGGSGKKGPMGIPSYQTTDEDYSWDWGDTGGYDYGAGKTEADIAADPGRDVSVLGETGYSDEELRDYAAGLGTTVRGLGPIGTERAKAEHHDTLTDMRKGILGLYGDRMTRGEALEGAKRSAFTAWRNSIGKYSRDTAKDYDAWFAKQDPNALIAGYKIGDPVGQAMQSSFDIVNKQLKKRFADELKHRSIVADPDEEVEMTREELSALVKDAEIEGLEDFTPYTGLDYPAWMPGGMAGKAVDFLSRTVIGTGTVGGAGVHLHKDGSITAISPEDSPGYDHELHHEPGSEPIKRKRLPPVAKPATLEPEKELTGMAKYIADRPKVSSREKSNLPLSALLDQIYGEGQGQQLLG